MKKVKISENDVERIEALKSYNILDTLPEKEYDEITRLASFICQSPISLITFVDSSRQVFKSRFGINSSFNAREFGFCAHGINAEEELFIISDTHNDERFHDHPMVLGEPYIGFYAGVPLVDQEGFVLGTLCVIDKKPREISREQRDALKCLANQVIKLLDLRKKNEMLIQSEKMLATYAQQMENFAYTASHDLIEPVRMVKSFIQLLKNDYPINFDDNAKKMVEYSLEGAQRMENLILDLLEYSKTGKIKDDFQELDVNQILEEAKKNLMLVINEKNAILNIGDMPKIRASRVGMVQLFQNLIGNAMKYQPKGAAPEISVKADENDTHWLFSIIDNGIGIPKIHLESIFTTFKRLHRKEVYSGTGIGLAICKKIIEQHGGNIYAESEEGNGSTFHFSISKSVAL